MVIWRRIIWKVGRGRVEVAGIKGKGEGAKEGVGEGGVEGERRAWVEGTGEGDRGIGEGGKGECLQNKNCFIWESFSSQKEGSC